LREIKLKVIDNSINKLGFKSNNSFFGKIKLGYIHFTEENEKTNLTSKGGSCCSNPTEILDKFKK
jgi:hypothetical protein